MPIYAGDRKAALYKGDYCPAEMYKGSNKVAGWTEQPKPVPCAWNDTYNDTVGIAAVGRGKQSSGVYGINLMTNGDFSNGTVGWSSTNAEISAAGGICTSIANKLYGGAYQMISNFEKCKGHVLYSFAWLKSYSNKAYMVFLNDSTAQVTVFPEKLNEFVFCSGVLRISENAAYVYNKVQDSNSADWQPCYIRNVFTIDLTDTFGAGKEPTKAQLDNMMQYGNKWFDGAGMITSEQAYRHNSPSPSYPQPIVESSGVIKCEGRNLFDETVFAANNCPKQADSSYYVSDPSKLYGRTFFEAGDYLGQIILSFDVKYKYANSGNFFGVQLYLQYTDGSKDVGKLGGFSDDTWYHVIFVSSSNKTISSVMATYGTRSTQTLIRNTQISKTIVELPYQPYRPPTSVTLPTLRAIPDGSGGWSCRDEMHSVGGGWYEVVRNVGVKEFDGTENWVLGKYPTGASTQFYTAKPTDMGRSVNKTINSHFTNARIVNGSSVGDSYNIYPALSTGLTTIDELLPWIAAQKSAGTPMTIWYESAEPTTERVYLGDLKSYPQYTGLTVQGDYPPDVTGTAKVCGVKI